MSDGTHLSNVAGNKRQWPEYMAIGNLSSKISQMPSTQSVIVVALLLIRVQNRNIAQKQLLNQP
jgi:hypothetical protein